MSKIYYKAKHILLDDEDDVEYVIDQLHAGQSFEDLAKEFSSCESRVKGGNLGRFSSGMMDPLFEKALYKMKVGELKYPVQTRFGYHIIIRLE